MKPFLISFVGVDIHSNINDFDGFNNKVEFSVFYSESNFGNRYPNYAFCKSFLTNNSIKHDKSIHLCGQVAINKYLMEDPEVLSLCEKAKRIQLNFALKNFTDHDKVAANIVEIANKYKHTIILQQNKSKESFNNTIKSFYNSANQLTVGYGNIHVLHDSSGGFSKVIKEVDSPDSKFFTGYAGGINPDNVEGIINLINSKNDMKVEYYVDIESGVRQNDIFSLDLCRKVDSNITNMFSV